MFRRGILPRPAFNAATPAALISERSASRSCVRPADVRNRRRAAPRVSAIGTPQQRRASTSPMMAPVLRLLTGQPTVTSGASVECEVQT